MISFVVFLGMSAASCSNNPEDNQTTSKSTISETNQVTNSTSQDKISSLLQIQINLRKAQLANPTPERLDQMQAQGMNITDIGIQRIYIYLNQQLTQEQVVELQSFGVTLYPDTWIPPLTNHPAGFIMANIPVDQLETLAAKNYVIKVDSAEIQSQTQFNIPSGNIK
jgi:hypothetical protein